MAKIIDLTDGDGDHDVLTQTAADGLLGGTFLSDQPLGRYLTDGEDPKYLLQNKKSGLRIETDDGVETLEPSGDYRALALATDLRLLVVVGDEAGDRSISLPLSETVQADVEAGLRSSTLTIETLSEGRWAFPCRGDPAVVAEYLEDAAQAWANAGRLLDELEETLEAASSRLDAGEHEAAGELVADADTTLRTAVNRGSEVGPAARQRIADRASALQDELKAVRRGVHAAAGADAHARAQDRWSENEYESAATAYERAIESYDRALDIDGERPATAILETRIRGAVGERELLRVAPVVEADESRRRAASLTDSEAAAEQWEQALAGYRELLGLDWGKRDREFVVNRERIREQTVEIADDAVNDHLDAGKQWLTPGDELAVEGSDYEAAELYKMARHQFEQAHRLASEVMPDRVEEIETAIEAVEVRLDGEMPREVVPEEPITTEFDPPEATADQSEEWEDSTVELSADESGAESVGQGGQAAAVEENGDSAEEHADDSGEFAQLSFPNAADEQDQPEAGESPTTRRTTDSDRTGQSQDADDGGSVLDEIQSRKRGGSQSDHSPSEEPRTDGAHPVGDEPGNPPQGAKSAPEEPQTAVDERQSQAIDIPVNELPQRLRALEEGVLTDLVAAVWERDGWSTSVFTGGGDTTYDIVATREEDDTRLLIWTLQRRDGGEIGEALVRRCGTSLENSHSADGAVIVTTGGFTRAASALASGFDVEIVDCAALAERVDAMDLPAEIAATLGR